MNTIHTIQSVVGRRRRAFTLVELLVVIAIIGILVTMIAPSLSLARYKVYRMRCQNNCREIARAAIAYSNAGEWHRGTAKNVLPSVGPTTSNWADLRLGNAGALWLLLTGKRPGPSEDTTTVRSGGAFLAPSTLFCQEAGLRSSVRSPTITDGGFTASAAYNTLSYSYISMVPPPPATTTPTTDTSWTIDDTSTRELPGSTIIVGDKNPRFSAGTGGAVGGQDGKNTKNHQGKGQAVASLDGAALWLTKTTVSAYNITTTALPPDDIYMSSSSSSSQRGSLTDIFLIP